MVATTGVTTSAEFLTKHWPHEIWDAFQHNLVLGRLVTQGRLAEGVKVDDEVKDLGKVLGARVTLLIDDPKLLQRDWQIREKYTTLIAYDLAASVDGVGLIQNAYEASSRVGTFGCDPLEDDVHRAIAWLDEAGAPLPGRFLWGSPSFHVAALRYMTGFVPSLSRNHDADPALAGVLRPDVEEADVGDLDGLPVYVSALANNLPTAEGQSTSLIAHRDAIMLWLALPTVEVVDADYLRVTLPYVIQEVKPEWLVAVAGA